VHLFVKIILTVSAIENVSPLRMNKYKTLVEFHRQGKTDVPEDDQVPLCAPQTPYEMAQDRSRASSVTGQRLPECSVIVNRTGFR
jgi:hypothetical protein